MSTFTTSFQHYIGGRAIRQDKELKVIHVEKEEIKLSLFTNDMILNIQYPKETTKKLLDVVNGFSNFTRYEENTQKINHILIY